MTAPPSGARSMQRAQICGFFREGAYPTHWNAPAYGPRNGALQNLHRQGLGIKPNNRRPARVPNASRDSPARIARQRGSIGTIRDSSVARSSSFTSAAIDPDDRPVGVVVVAEEPQVATRPVVDVALDERSVPQPHHDAASPLRMDVTLDPSPHHVD